MNDVSETSLSKIDHVQDLLDRLRLDREARSYGAVIVEGSTDVTSLERLQAAELRFFPTGGRANVLRAADRLDQEYLPGVICVADLDFDDEPAARTMQWFLVFTDDADMEAMLYWSAALERFLDEWSAKAKYTSYGGAKVLRDTIEEKVVPLAVLRSWSTLSGRGLKFDALDLMRLINKRDLQLSVTGLIDRLSQLERVQRADFEGALSHPAPVCRYTARLCARGRDRLAFVGAALRGAIGSLSKQQVADAFVERSLRLAVRPSDFIDTQFLVRFEMALSKARAGGIAA
jgi:hypothetical protein